MAGYLDNRLTTKKYKANFTVGGGCLRRRGRDFAVAEVEPRDQIYRNLIESELFGHAGNVRELMIEQSRGHGGKL